MDVPRRRGHDEVALRWPFPICSPPVPRVCTSAGVGEADRMRIQGSSKALVETRTGRSPYGRTREELKFGVWRRREVGEVPEQRASPVGPEREERRGRASRTSSFGLT